MIKTNKFNNEGFTLIEVILGIVILGIIVVPLLHVFVTGAHTAKINEEYSNATIAAENIIENIKSQDTVASIISNPELLGDDAILYTKGENFIYQIGLPVRQGTDEYYAMVNINTNSEANKKSICVGNSMDATFHMVDADTDALSDYTMLALEAFNSNPNNEGNDFKKPKMRELTRKINITAAKEGSSNNYNVDVTFTYEGRYGTVKETSRELVSDVEPQPYGKAAFSVYIFYNSNFNKLPENITINNKQYSTMDYNVFLVATDINNNFGKAKVNYKTQRSNKGTNKSITQTRVFTNIPKENVTYYAFVTPNYKKEKLTTGKLTEEIPIDRMYSIEVHLFPSENDIDEDDKIIMHMDAKKLG